MVDAIDGLQFSEGAGKAGRDALAAGAPILCDARMVSEGVTRTRLPANNEVIRRLHALGLVCDAGQALSRLIACTGSTGCAKGLADTKQDALQLAALLQRHGQLLSVHLSGCPRSCAAAHSAPVTLLAVAPGHYDLYFREAGQPGFGALHARNLTIEAVDALLDARSRSPLDA